MQIALNVGTLSLLWIVNLFNGTGLDQAYHVTDWAQRITVVLFIAVVLNKAIKERSLIVERKSLCVFGGLIACFLISSLINGFSISDAVDYLWVYCLIYLIARMEIDVKTMFWTGLIYGVLGFAILYIFDYGSALSGWNTNSIAMIGMHSFLIMLVPFVKTQRLAGKLALIASAVLFAVLVFPTDSRSGILFGSLAVLFTIGIIPPKIVTKNRRTTLFWLILPLLIAFLVILVSRGEYMDVLNRWSRRVSDKPLFNGRDELWLRGLESLMKNPLFGNGNFNAANWHNSAITCLVATGIIGFVFWIAGFADILDKAREYFGDYIVLGSFMGFIVLYVQQSVELGFISGNPTVLGYVLLGVMLGRIRYLKKESLIKKKEQGEDEK